MANSPRSYEPITSSDLQRLRHIADAGFNEFFVRNPRYAPLRDQVLCLALCQGAALHYLNGHNGVKDFDVWAFFTAMPDVTFPVRWRGQHDFGDPKFGQTLETPHFIGRRVDLMGRCLQVKMDDDPVTCLREYLKRGQSKSALCLSQKAVVLLEPVEQFGTIIWPTPNSKTAA